MLIASAPCRYGSDISDSMDKLDIIGDGLMFLPKHHIAFIIFMGWRIWLVGCEFDFYFDDGLAV